MRNTSMTQRNNTIDTTEINRGRTDVRSKEFKQADFDSVKDYNTMAEIGNRLEETKSSQKNAGLIDQDDLQTLNTHQIRTGPTEELEINVNLKSIKVVRKRAHGKEIFDRQNSKSAEPRSDQEEGDTESAKESAAYSKTVRQ